MKKLIVVLIFLVFSSSIFAKEIDPPKDIDKYFNEPYILGNYRLSYFGFNLYDIQAIIEKADIGKADRSKVAIHVRYNRDISKEDLMESTFEEVAQVSGKDKGYVIANYRKTLEKLFFEITEGDEKLAIKNGANFKFFYNDKLIDDFDDQFFADNFIGMWLSKKTSRPKMRQNLLNINE